MPIRVFLIIAIFALAQFSCTEKKMNTLLGLPGMAIAIALAAGISMPSILNDVISEGALRLHSLIMVVIFGSALAEIVKRSGIVEVLIRNTAEYLGDQLLLVSVLMMLLVALLSSVLAGLGAVVMMGTVVFPILVSLGISKLLAACIFILGLSIGGMFNLINWSLSWMCLN